MQDLYKFNSAPYNAGVLVFPPLPLAICAGTGVLTWWVVPSTTMPSSITYLDFPGLSGHDNLTALPARRIADACEGYEFFTEPETGRGLSGANDPLMAIGVAQMPNQLNPIAIYRRLSSTSGMFWR